MSDTKLPFAKDFKDLIVYQKAFGVSLEIHALTLSFPKYEQYGGIADQMRRASKSICANVAEGHGKLFYPAEWKRFLLIALGSAKEMQVWADYAVQLEYVPADKASEWTHMYLEIARMLQTLIQKVGK